MNKEKKQWVEVSAGEYLSTSVLALRGQLEPAVYELEGSDSGQMYLRKLHDEFPMPERIYNLKEEFIERCITAFKMSGKCLGILLHGPKGTGKTITAEQIAIGLNLPVILITAKSKNQIVNLIYLQQECIIFIDEGDKIFSRYAEEKTLDVKSMILSILDGSLTPESKLLFLFTANDITALDTSLIDRPGRIRYCKEFTGLETEEISDILSHLLLPELNTPEFVQDFLRTLSKLDIVTIDVLKSVIEECNNFKQPFSKFYDDMNIGFSSKSRNSYEVTMFNTTTQDSHTVMCTNIYPGLPFVEGLEGFAFEIDGYYRGTVKKTIGENQILMKETEDAEESILVTAKSNPYSNKKVLRLLGI